MTNGQVIAGNQNTTLLLNQLKAAKDQYPNLSKDEERAMIKKYKKNRKELNKLLFMHNIKLVFNMAKKYMSKTNDFDSLVQDGMIGLGEAVNRFDIKKNIKFCTYAYIWIKKYMTMNFYGKQVEIDKRSMSLDMPSLCTSRSSGGNDVTLENYVNEYIEPTCNSVKTISEELSANEQKEICKSLMDELEQDNSLSSTDKAMFIDMFYNREKTRDIADKYGVTPADVNNVKGLVLSKFRDILNHTMNITSYSQLS